MTQEESLSVSAIKNGTVIDHIPPGQALILVRLLALDLEKQRVTIGLHLTSPLMGYKDLIKVEERFLTERELEEIAVFAPEATVSCIKNYRVEKKAQALLPRCIERILVCPNTRCISRHEPIASQFLVEKFKQMVFLRCHFCEKLFERTEISEYTT